MKYFIHETSPTIIRPFVKMLERTDAHYYETESGKIYPSISTILKLLTKTGIDAWRNRVGHAVADRISNESIQVGNTLHKMIETYLNNKPLPTVEEFKYVFSPIVLFETVKPILDQNIDNIHALEMKIYSDELELAGTVDCVAKFNGELSVIDFKNSRKKKTRSQINNYELQTLAYSIMWKQCMGMDIKQGVIIIANWDGGKGEPEAQIFKVQFSDALISDLWDAIIQFDKTLYIP